MIDLIRGLCRHSADQLFASSESRTPQRRDGFETLVNMDPSHLRCFGFGAWRMWPSLAHAATLAHAAVDHALISISERWLRPNRALRSHDRQCSAERYGTLSRERFSPLALLRHTEITHGVPLSAEEPTLEIAPAATLQRQLPRRELVAEGTTRRAPHDRLSAV